MKNFYSIDGVTPVAEPSAFVHPTAVVIAIDGPGGSGKGTIAKQVAKRLGFNLLDSGALYRGCVLWHTRPCAVA